MKVRPQTDKIEGLLCLHNISLEEIKSENYECKISGYGAQSEEPPELDGNLYESAVNITDWESCKKQNFAITITKHHEENFFCAGVPGSVDSCRGDSGE